MVAQVLDGGGTASNQIEGLWSRVSTATPENVHECGAAATDFDREDILTTKNVVDLAKNDGGPGQWILGTGLYQLAENKLRGGASSERYLLENIMMENRMVHHFADFAPSGTNDAGLFVKMDRCPVLVWGDSFQLQEIPSGRERASSSWWWKVTWRWCSLTTTWHRSGGPKASAEAYHAYPNFRGYRFAGQPAHCE